VVEIAHHLLKKPRMGLRMLAPVIEIWLTLHPGDTALIAAGVPRVVTLQRNANGNQSLTSVMRMSVI